MKINLKRIDSILSHYKGRSDAVIPVLQEVQEKFGWVPPEAIGRVADALKVFPSEVYGVATFYAQFHLKPRGKHIIKVCRGTACHVNGSATISRDVRDLLNIDVGETSKDMKFSFEHVACVGACAKAPVFILDENIFGKSTSSKAKKSIKTVGNGS
jgi:NADH-quinone oxidoreductase subunit E